MTARAIDPLLKGFGRVFAEDLTGEIGANALRRVRVEKDLNGQRCNGRGVFQRPWPQVGQLVHAREYKGAPTDLLRSRQRGKSAQGWGADVPNVLKRSSC